MLITEQLIENVECTVINCIKHILSQINVNDVISHGYKNFAY